VSLKLLDEAFTIARQPCPVEGCGKPIVSHSRRVDGSCAKYTFLCQKGHPTAWTSCEQIGRQMLVVNKLVPAATVMAGLKLVPMKRFLALLQVDSHNPDYMKSSTIDLLAKLTNQLWEEQVAVVRETMLEDDCFDCGVFVDSLCFASCSLCFEFFFFFFFFPLPASLSSFLIV
jgi:hypothetical protein